MRIAIYGAGALGTILGAYLTKNDPNDEIHLFNRNKSHVKALNDRGAHIIGEIDYVQPVRAFLPEEMEGEYDYIFLLTKQLDNANTIRFLEPHLKADGALCTMQNGLPEPPIAEVLGRDRTLGCTIGWGATLGEPGESRLTSSPEALIFTLGAPYPEAEKHLQTVKAILENMGSVSIEENFLGARWTKLLINATFSGMGTVIGDTFGAVCDDRRARSIAQRVIKECIDVIKAAGIRPARIMGYDIVKLFDYHGPIKKAISYNLIPIAMKRHRGILSGMLVDIRKGKPCEVDAIVGSVCVEGDKVGVDTPTCDRMYEIIKGFERGEGEPSTDNLSLFK